MHRYTSRSEDGEGLAGALEHAFRERAVVETLRKFVAEGTIERVGLLRAGDWVFRGIKDAAAPLPAGVVSLAAKRRERDPLGGVSLRVKRLRLAHAGD